MNIYKMEKRNTRQMETAYVLYMMLGSMFNHTYCKTGMMSDRLELYYKEMGNSAQERCEASVLRFISKHMGKYENTFERMNSQVSIINDGDYIVIGFYTGFENLMVYVAKNGEFKVIVEADTASNN